MTKTIAIVILIAALGVAVWLLIPRWDAHAQAEAYRTQAEQAIEERDQALAVADSMAEMSAAKTLYVMRLQRELDSANRAQVPFNEFINNALRDLDHGGLDSIRADIVRRPSE